MGIGAAAGAATATGLIATERSMPKTTTDKEVMVGNQKMHLIVQEFNPKEGEIKDSQALAIFLVGAPMRPEASVTGAHAEDLSRTGIQTVEIGARPIGLYEGNAGRFGS